MQKFEDILVQRILGIQKADKQCRKIFMGEVPWSTTLQIARNEIQLWANVVARKKGMKVNTRFISRLEKKANISHALRCTLLISVLRRQEAYKRYYLLKKNATELRESWLMDLAALKAKASGGDHTTY